MRLSMTPFIYEQSVKKEKNEKKKTILLKYLKI